MLTPEDILADHSPAVRELVQHLRVLIHQIVPEAVEKAYPSWHAIGYTHPHSGYFSTIFPQQDGVRLGFEFGVLLPDPRKLLEGSGKQVRYVSIRDEQDIPQEAIQDLIRAALTLPESHSIKLELVRSQARKVP